MTDIYSILAPYYDGWNAEIDYPAWADGAEAFFRRYAKGEVRDVLDLACGTGRMTVELAKRGYDMIGVDRSPEMLDAARNAAENAGEAVSSRILWLLQEMTSFELYGTVDAVLCCLDSVNHFTDRKDLLKVFSLVHNYLIPDGVFLFDVNAKGKFERVYGDKSYVLEDDGVFCVWQNDYDSKSGLCDFYITLFRENEKGLYIREDAMQTERAYSVRQIRNALNETGFEFLGVSSDFDFTPGCDGDLRLYFAARCKKP